MIQDTTERLKETEKRQQTSKANDLLVEAGTVLGRDPTGSLVLMAHAATLMGEKVPMKQILEVMAKHPDAVKRDGEMLRPIIKRMQEHDPTAPLDYAMAAISAQSPLPSMFVGFFNTALADLPGMPFLGKVHDAVRQEETRTGHPVSPEREAEIAEGLAQGPGGQQGFRAAYAASKLFKDRYDLGKKIREEKATGAFQLRAAQTGLAQERTRQAGREKPAERKERTQEEARQALGDFEQGQGADLSDQELLTLYKDAGLGVPRLGALDPKITGLKAARKKAGGRPANAGAPAKADPLGIR